MVDHAALQPVWRVVRSLMNLHLPQNFASMRHLDHHSAVKLVEGFIVSSHGPLGVLQLPTQPHQPRLTQSCIDPQTSDPSQRLKLRPLDLHCLRAALSLFH